MLNSTELKYQDVTIPYFWGQFCLENIVGKINEFDADKYLIITDSTVENLYGNKLLALLSSSKQVKLLSFPPGEKFKTIDTVTHFLEEGLKWGITRRSIVIALGGGIPGNLGGLVASLLYRGIRLIQIPTTSIAMFDSVLSLKQAVNSNLSKNSIGSFYIPTAIITDLDFLKTLPLSEAKSGLCETIKNVLAITPESYNELKLHLKKSLEGDYECLNYIFSSSINAKNKVMKLDKYEKNKALVLEYGHTVGHALEMILSADSNFRITHGEAVALGMILEAEISNQLGYLSRAEVSKHYELLNEINVSTKIPGNINAETICAALKYDNKRGYLNPTDDEATMILLEKLGNPLTTNGFPLINISLSILKENLQLITKTN